jgi:hypothetical protein
VPAGLAESLPSTRGLRAVTQDTVAASAKPLAEAGSRPRSSCPGKARPSASRRARNGARPRRRPAWAPARNSAGTARRDAAPPLGAQAMRQAGSRQSSAGTGLMEWGVLRAIGAWHRPLARAARSAGRARRRTESALRREAEGPPSRSAQRRGVDHRERPRRPDADRRREAPRPDLPQAAGVLGLGQPVREGAGWPGHAALRLPRSRAAGYGKVRSQAGSLPL